MKALVLSGGGVRGAFQVGMIRKLTELGHTWDIIAGVSVGALNGSFMAQFKPEDQRTGALELEQFWLNVTGNESIYKSWFLGKLASLWKGGLYNTAPLKKLVDSKISPNLQVQLRVGAVCLETGEYRYVDENTEHLHDWILASASFPVAFPPVKIGNHHWIDGGVRDITPVSDISINEDVESVDVILTAPTNGYVQPIPANKTSSAFEIALRCAALMSDEIFINDLELMKWDSIINVYSPQFIDVIDDPLQFDPEAIRSAIRVGYNSI